MLKKKAETLIHGFSPEYDDDSEILILGSFPNKIALYDVIYSCEITGSSDSSIKNVKAADVCGILSQSKIKRIYLNGKTAGKLYYKYIYPDTGIKAEVLPSTSPANAAFKLPKLLEAWKIIKN